MSRHQRIIEAAAKLGMKIDDNKIVRKPIKLSPVAAKYYRLGQEAAKAGVELKILDEKK